MTKKPSRLTKVILKTAEDMFDAKIIDEKSYEKITLRHLAKKNINIKLDKQPVARHSLVESL